MSEAESSQISDPPGSKHYRIRKEVVGLCIAAMVGWVGYQVHDWWTHMNWPPHDARNQHYTSSISCNIEKYLLYKKDIPSVSTIGGFSGALDRRMFIEQPSCMASLYLYSEGTGIRSVYKIYDRKTQRQTARIEITYSNIDERELK